MNRAKAVLVVLCIITMLSYPTVVAQTNQGLEWGYDPEDEVSFMMHLDAEDMQIDEEIYVNSTGPLPSIPDSLTNWSDIPYA
ncbi:MAG: hypothetical protein ACFFFD_14695, partial [Promethearchaeota archaeon]